jgi:prepilin-type N-terminal cleavage/methylation domain-containing protein
MNLLKTYPPHKGFSLAELLVALAVLGIIATFSIPKLLDSMGSSKTAAIAKETAAMIAGAYSEHKASVTAQANTRASDLTNYLNYVEVITSGSFPTDPYDGVNLQDCSDTLPCLMLHSGAILQYDTGMTFGGTDATRALVFNVDPDGDGNAAGRVTFIQFFNGRLTTRGKNGADALTDGATLTQQVTDPSYIARWD